MVQFLRHLYQVTISMEGLIPLCYACYCDIGLYTIANMCDCSIDVVRAYRGTGTVHRTSYLTYL